MNTQYIYHEEGHNVVEKSQYDKPSYDSYQTDWDIYNNYIASLKEYPCHESCKWKDGQVLEEGKDFELKTCNCIFDWCNLKAVNYDNFCILAYPLPQVTESEDELDKWIKSIQPDYEYKESYQHGFFDALQAVKDKLQHFTIKRNQ